MGNLSVGMANNTLSAVLSSRVSKPAMQKIQANGLLNFRATNMNKEELLALIDDIVSNEYLDTELKIKLLQLILEMLEKEMGKIPTPTEPAPAPEPTVVPAPTVPTPEPTTVPSPGPIPEPTEPTVVPEPTDVPEPTVAPSPNPLPFPLPINPWPVKPDPNPDEYPEIDTNGVIESFGQGRTGDCYLLSSLMALASNKEGAKILKDNISKNSDGSVTITLPGAMLADRELRKDGYTSRITGAYTITKEEFYNARQSGKYSRGDDDVLLYELAFEKYRTQVLETKDANHTRQAFDVGRYIGGGTYADPLKGGLEVDAMFVLSANMGTEYSIGENKDVITELPKAASCRPASINLDYDQTSRREIDRYLKRFERDPERYALTAAFRSSATSGHAYHLKEVSGNNVILVNPWDSDKEIVMSKDEFLRQAECITVWDTKEKGFWQGAKDLFDDFCDNLFA